LEMKLCRPTVSDSGRPSAPRHLCCQAGLPQSM
jgi:hypothetical protein